MLGYYYLCGVQAWSCFPRGKLTQCLHPWVLLLLRPGLSHSLARNFAYGSVTKAWKATVEFGLYRGDYLQVDGWGLSGATQISGWVDAVPPLRLREAF